MPLAGEGPTKPNKKHVTPNWLINQWHRRMTKPQDQNSERLEPQKRRYISPEGLERLRAAAFAHEPWRFSTGPRSARGKAQSVLNGKLRQRGPVSVRERRRQVADVLETIKSMKALRSAVLETRPGADDGIVLGSDLSTK